MENYYPNTTQSEQVFRNNNYYYSTENFQDSESRRGFLSDEFMQYAVRVVYVAMVGCAAFFGFGTNIINVVVFLKQGFADSVTISFFALAIADLLSVSAAIVQSISYNIWINELVTDINFRHVQYIYGGWPRGIFARLSSFITAYICFERCLCIMLPLKVKFILTRRVTFVIIGFIYISILSFLIAPYYSLKLDWRFSTQLNKSVLSLAYRYGKSSKDLESDYLIVLSSFQVASYILVVLFTVALIARMKSKSKWREKTLTSGQLETTTNRDRKVMKMVVMICVTFIVLYIPGVSQITAMYVIPEYTVTSIYRNTYIFTWSVAAFGDVTSASVNIFYYYKMSSKYSAILNGMIPAAVLKCIIKNPDEKSKS